MNDKCMSIIDYIKNYNLSARIDNLKYKVEENTTKIELLTEANNEITSSLSELDNKADLQTVLNKFIEIDNSIGLLNNNKASLQDLTDLLNLLISDINDVEAGGLIGIEDLTPLFQAGNAALINAKIDQVRDTKIMYVGPGDYYVDDTIKIYGKAFYCFGNIIGPLDASSLSSMADYWPNSTYSRNDNVRTVVFYNGSFNKCYIKKITVRHNYCGFYVYFSSGADILIGEIVGDYSNTTKVVDGQTVPISPKTLSVYRSTFSKNGSNPTTRNDLYDPIPDSWVMNSGFHCSYLADSNIRIGGIRNLNYGIYLINSIPKSNEVSKALNIDHTAIWGCKFDIFSIVCKKAIDIDLYHRIKMDNGNLTYATNSTPSTDHFIRANEFNIICFDYASAELTNTVETLNEDFYDQTDDNRRIMFNIIDKTRSSNADSNVFNAVCLQGIYDTVINVFNAEHLKFKGFLLVNDVPFACLSGEPLPVVRTIWHRLRRNRIYVRGKKDGRYVNEGSIDTGAVLIFNNCHDITFENTGKAFVRPEEIEITNSKNIIITNVAESNGGNDTFYNYDTSGDNYHIITKNNYKHIYTMLYDGNDLYRKGWNDGYTEITNE